MRWFSWFSTVPPVIHRPVVAGLTANAVLRHVQRSWIYVGSKNHSRVTQGNTTFLSPAKICCYELWRLISIVFSVEKMILLLIYQKFTKQSCSFYTCTFSLFVLHSLRQKWVALCPGFYPEINMWGGKSQGGGWRAEARGAGIGEGASCGGGSEPSTIAPCVNSSNGFGRRPRKFEIWCNLRLQKSLLNAL